MERVCGHFVPELVAADGELLLIEMSIVSPPFLLDFAKATLDFPPDFPPEVMEAWLADKAEQFEERWPAVRGVMLELERRYGIFLTDINPGNITFAD